LPRLLLLAPFSQDCGPVGANNFTKSDDDGGWWDDDDDYWTFNDNAFLGADAITMKSVSIVVLFLRSHPILTSTRSLRVTDQAAGLEANRGKIKKYVKQSENSGPGWMFLVVLEGMVYTVAAIFAAAALYLGK
jgi:hypothetical protein